MAIKRQTASVSKSFPYYSSYGYAYTADVGVYFGVLYDDSNPSRICPSVYTSGYDTNGYSYAPSSISLKIYINDSIVYNGSIPYRYRDSNNFKVYATWGATSGGSILWPSGTEEGLTYYNITNPKGIKVRFTGSYNCPTASKTTDTFTFDNTITFDFPYKAKITSHSFPSKIGGNLSFTMKASSSALSGYSYKNFIKLYVDGSYYTLYSWNTSSSSFTKTQELELSKIIPILREHDSSSSRVNIYLTCETYYNNSFINVDSYNTYAFLPSVSISQSGSWTAGTQCSLAITEDAELTSKNCKYVLKDLYGTTVHEFSSSGNVTFSPSVSVFASLITDRLSKTIYYYVYAYIGSVSDSNFVSKSSSISVNSILRESDVAPVPTATITDASGVYSQVGKYVSGVSYLNISVNTGLRYNSTLRFSTYRINGKSYSSNSFTTDILSWNNVSSGVMSLKLSVTDNRGATGTATINLNVVQWDYPIISNFSVHRGYYVNNVWTANDNGNYVRVDWGTNIYAVENHNTKRVIITVPSGDVVPTLSPSGYTDSGIVYSPASTEQSFTITITATDSFGSTTATTILSTAGVALDVLAGGKGLGIGKVAEEENCVEISPDWTLKVGGMTLADYIRSIVG